MTLLFTDLKGSTALYERIGDAGAYHLVRGSSLSSRTRSGRLTEPSSKPSGMR